MSNQSVVNRIIKKVRITGFIDFSFLFHLNNKKIKLFFFLLTNPWFLKGIDVDDVSFDILLRWCIVPTQFCSSFQDFYNSNIMKMNRSPSSIMLRWGIYVFWSVTVLNLTTSKAGIKEFWHELRLALKFPKVPKSNLFS